MDDLSEVKFGEIANMISAESKDDAHGYHEDINGEGVTLVDWKRMPNLDWDDSYDVPTYG